MVTGQTISQYKILDKLGEGGLVLSRRDAYGGSHFVVGNEVRV